MKQVSYLQIVPQHGPFLGSVNLTVPPKSQTSDGQSVPRRAARNRQAAPHSLSMGLNSKVDVPNTSSVPSCCCATALTENTPEVPQFPGHSTRLPFKSGPSNNAVFPSVNVTVPLIVLNLDMDPAVPWWASSGNAREPVRLNAGKHGTRGHLGGNTRKFAAKQGSHP